MFKLSVIGDEVSQDFQKVVDFAQEFALEGLEIRGVWNTAPQDLSSEQIREMKRILQGTNLKVCSIASPFFKCDIDSKQEYRNHLRILQNCIHLAKELNCNLIRTFTFWKEGNFDDYFNRIVEYYQDPIKMAEENNITLGIENESTTMVGTGEELARFVKALGSPVTRVLWDPQNEFHRLDGQETFRYGYEAVKSNIVHVHLKDAQWNEKTQEVVNAELGKGGVNIQRQLQALKDDGYEGFVSLETHWRPGKVTDEILARAGCSASATKDEIASRICMMNLRNMVSQLI